MELINLVKKKLFILQKNITAIDDKNITSNNKQVKMAKEVYGGGPNNGDKLSPACSQPAPSFKNALI